MRVARHTVVLCCVQAQMDAKQAAALADDLGSDAFGSDSLSSMRLEDLPRITEY